MKKVFYSLDELKNQARLLHKSLKEMNQNVSYMQSMQLVAKSHGFKNFETIEKAVLDATIPLQAKSSTEVVLDTDLCDRFWITVKNISVYIAATDEGVIVDLYALNDEDNESYDSAQMLYSEAEELE